MTASKALDGPKPASKLNANATSFVFSPNAPVWTPSKPLQSIPAPTSAPAAAAPSPAKSTSSSTSTNSKAPLKPTAKSFVPNVQAKSFVPNVQAKSFVPNVQAKPFVPPSVSVPETPSTPSKPQASDVTPPTSSPSKSSASEPDTEEKQEPAPAKSPLAAFAEKVEQEQSTKAEEEPVVQEPPAPVVSAKEEAEKRLLYSIQKLLDMVPAVCPMPASVVDSIVAYDKNAKLPSSKGPRRSDSSRSLHRNASFVSRRGGRGGRGRGPEPPSDNYEPLSINEETRWKPSKSKSRLDTEESETYKGIKEAKAILNKLSIEKFDRLSDQLIEVAVRSRAVLDGVIEMVLQKAQMEWHFATMYAELCSKMAQTEMPNVEGEDKLDTNKLFRKLLLSQCQKEFEVTPSRDGWEDLSEEDRAEKELILKRATLGHIRFVGELYKQRMLSSRIMHECIQRLFGDTNKPDEESLECLCNLLSTIGQKLEASVRDQAELDLIKQYYGLIQRLSKVDNAVLCTRVRFMLQDLLELRQNRWQARRKETKAMTIAEVHAEVAREEKAKAKASNTRSSRSQSTSHFPDRRGGSALNAWKSRGQKDGDGWETVKGAKWNKTRSQSDRLPKDDKSVNAFSSLKKEEKKPEKKVLTEKEFEKKVNGILEEFVSLQDLKEAAESLNELDSRQHHGRIPTQGLNMGLEKGPAERDAVAKILADWYVREMVTKEEMKSALDETMEFAEDLEIDIPKALTYISDMIAPSVANGGVDLVDLVASVEHLRASGKAAKVVGGTLRQMDEDVVKQVVQDTQFDPTSVLKEEDRHDQGRRDFYQEWKLDYLL